MGKLSQPGSCRARMEALRGRSGGGAGARVSARQLPGEDGSLSSMSLSPGGRTSQPGSCRARMEARSAASSRPGSRVSQPGSCRARMEAASGCRQSAHSRASQPGSCRARMEAVCTQYIELADPRRLSPAVAGRGWKRRRALHEIDLGDVSARQLPGEDGSRYRLLQAPCRDHRLSPAVAGRGWKPHQPRDLGQPAGLSQPGSCRARMEASPSRASAVRASMSQPGSCRARMEAATGPTGSTPSTSSQPGSCRARMEARCAGSTVSGFKFVSARQLPGEDGSSVTGPLNLRTNSLSPAVAGRGWKRQDRPRHVRRARWSQPGSCRARMEARAAASPRQPPRASQPGSCRARMEAQYLRRRSTPSTRLSPAVAGRGWKRREGSGPRSRAGAVSARQLPGEDGSGKFRPNEVRMQRVSARQLPGEDGSRRSPGVMHRMSRCLSPAVAGRGWKRGRARAGRRNAGRLSPAVAGRGWKRQRPAGSAAGSAEVSARQLPGEDGSSIRAYDGRVRITSQPGSCRARMEASRCWPRKGSPSASQPGSCRARMEAPFTVRSGRRP